MLLFHLILYHQKIRRRNVNIFIHNTVKQFPQFLTDRDKVFFAVRFQFRLYLRAFVKRTFFLIIAL